MLQKDTIRVLLIQDNPDYIKFVQETLNRDSTTVFAVRSALTLREGIDLLREVDYDIVLLELSLPDSRALNTYLAVQDESPYVPVIILTSLDDEIIALQAIKRGAQDYVLKGQVYSLHFPRTVRYAIERQRMRVHLMDLSLKDELTSLYNRRGFFLLANQQIKTATRSGQEMLLILFDVNGLKQINDQFGHLHGDWALGSIGFIMRHSFRKSDIVGRIGGD